MITKKNKKIDPRRNSFLYFQIGLIAVSLMSYLVIESKTYVDFGKVADLPMPVTMPTEDEKPFTFKMPEKKRPKPVDVVKKEPIKLKKLVDDIKIIDNDDTAQKITDVTTVLSDSIAASLDYNEIVEVDVEDDDPVIFKMIEEAPMFPGCEKVAKSEQKMCFEKKIMRHIRRNLRYPEEAQELGVTGRVNVVFVIDENGEISQVQKRGPDKSLEDEAERVIRELPKLTPGKQRGKPVKVAFSIPISFK